MAVVQPIVILHVSGNLGAASRSAPAAAWHGERSMSDLEPRFRPDENHDRSQPGVDDSYAVERAPDSTGRGRDVWRASASFGWLIGTVLLMLAGAGIVLLLVRVPSSSGGQRIAWIAVAAVLTTLAIGIAVLLRALPTMRYRFDGDAVVVEWLRQRRVVPLADIHDVIFEPDQPLRLPGWEPFWPGYYVATVRSAAGTWHTWATQLPQRRVRLVTSQGIIAISPERPVRFIAELERRRRLAGQQTTGANARPGEIASEPAIARPADALHDLQSLPTHLRASPDSEPMRDRSPRIDRKQPHRSESSRNPLTTWLRAYRDVFRDQFLADQIASALVAVGVVLPVLMVAYLYSQYEGLPEQIPVQWDSTGDVAELTTPSGLWRFPRIAVVILIVNTSLATLLIGVDRHLARLLVAGVPLAQVILFIALVRAIN